MREKIWGILYDFFRLFCYRDCFINLESIFFVCFEVCARVYGVN